MSDKLSRRDAVRVLGAAVAGPAIASSSAAARLAGYNAVVPPVTDLRGKTLVLNTRSRPLEVPLVLAGCSFETHGGRLFLAGTNVPPCGSDTYNWTDGVRQLVAWDAVEDYLIFESVEQYYARLITPNAETGSDPRAVSERSPDGDVPF